MAAPICTRHLVPSSKRKPQPSLSNVACLQHKRQSEDDKRKLQL